MKRGLFLRKPMRSAYDQGEDQHVLKRHLNWFHLILIGIGAIIGAGIFVVTGQAAAVHAGPAITLSFVIAAIICIFAGLCYAELSSLIPVSGGAYSYIYTALGEFPAWIVAWAMTVQYLATASTVAVGWSGYLINILKDWGLVLGETYTRAPFFYDASKGWGWSGSFVNLPAMGLIALIGILITIGIKAATHFNNVMVFIKLSAILLFLCMGIPHINTENWVPFIPENTGLFGEFGWSGVLRAAGLVFFAYIGFDTVSTLAQEAKNPQRDLPRGILGSLGISTLAYILIALVLTGVVSYRLLDVPSPMALALDAMGSKFFWVNSLIKAAILAGLATVALVQILGQTRVFFAIGQDGLLPKPFYSLHKRWDTPFFSTVVTTSVSMIIAGLFPIEMLGQLVSISTLLIFAIVCLGVWILRRTHPEFKRSFRVPFVPLIPILGVVFCLVQMCFLPLITWLQLAGWLVIGIFVYFCYSIRHSKMRKEST